MYIVYCQNKPKSEHIVSEYIDTYFEVRSFNHFAPYSHSMMLYCTVSCHKSVPRHKLFPSFIRTSSSVWDTDCNSLTY